MSVPARCQKCGVRNTGWRAVPRFGVMCCPACAHGVKRVSTADMLTRRRALLARLEAEGDTSPGLVRFRHEVERGIEELERRKKEEAEDERERENNGSAGACGL